MSIEQIPTGAENAEVIINELIASIEDAFTYGNDPRVTAGLDRGYYGGRWGGFATSDSTHTFGASVTTYVSVNRSSGALNYSTSNTNYNDSTNYARVETVVTGASAVTSVTNDRGGPGGIHGGAGGGGGGGAVSSVNGQTGAVVLDLDDLGDVSASSPSVGDVLTYDGSVGWIASPPSGGGGLANFTDSIDTASPNNGTPAARLLATNAASNVDAIFSPKGTGAFALQQADNTTTGGNKRGAGAADLQTVRSAAAQVASGTRAFAAGASNVVSATNAGAIGSDNTVSGNNAFSAGTNNTASGAPSIALGLNHTASGNGSVAAGNFCTASGANAVAIGNTCTADAADASAHGNSAIARGIVGASAFASGQRSSAGDAQRRELMLRRLTTDATPVRATSGGAAATTNQLNIPIRSTAVVKGLVAAHRQSNNDYKSWEFRGTLVRDTGGTVTLGSTITPTVVDASGGASTWDVTVTADDTDKVLGVAVTGQTSADISWTVHLLSVECTT